MKSLHQVLCHAAILFLAATLAGLAGCSKRYSDLPAYSPIPFREYQNQSAGRFKSSFVAEQIDAYFRGTDPGPIGVTTLVNIDDLYTTSTFGRMFSEQLISELAMMGYDVVELRHSDALQFMNTAGEFALSRDTAAVKPARDLGGVVAGTYTVSPERVYVNVRLIDPKSSMILSAGSVEMEKTKELSRMLRGGSFVQVLDRIPVKHLGYATYPAALFPGQNRAWDMEEGGSDFGSGVSPMLPSTSKGKRH